MDVRFHPAARAELVEAIRYHEDARPGFGSKFQSEVEVLLARIVDFPQSGRTLPGYPPRFEIRAFRLHRFRYALLVAPVEHELVVFAVAHSSRKPGYWRDRLPG